VLRDLYRIESVLGAGGYALTYLGSHKGLDQKVAIKEYMPDQIAVREQDHLTLRPRADSDDDYERGLRRFAKEARTLAKFRHPGIVPVTDIFEENGTAYMVMEYVEGESLHQHLGRVGTLVEPAFRAIFDPILEALAEVHANGILHRDIKPANIYVRADGSPVLLDFGNSREALGTKAQSLTVALTPGYAPSEQYSSRGKQGPWTDIYSLGATMYMAITGNRPPEAPDRVLDDDYVRVKDTGKDIEKNYAAALLEAVDQALAVRPDGRPQDIAEFQELLEGRATGPRTIMPAAARGQSGAAKTPPRSANRREIGRDERRAPGKRRLAIAALVAAVLVGGGAFGWMKYQEAEATRLAVEAQKARLAAIETARSEAVRRREAARFERAAIKAEERATEEARRAAWQREQRQKTEERRKTEESRERSKKKPPRCRDVGGYEAYMKRTGKVCML